MVTQRAIPLQSEYRITEKDANTTLSAGVADTRTRIARFTTPDRTKFVIRENDILSITTGTDAATPVADSSVVEVVRSDPNGILQQQIVLASYQTVKEFQDRNKLYTFGQRIELNPEDRLDIYLTADIIGGTAQTQFQISTRRITTVRLNQ